jgi:ribosomal protein S18 acetylase RimI-like enzyme
MVEAFTFDFANTPFYSGLYGGEKAGMDEDHPDGMELLKRCHFKVSTGAVIMVCDLPARIAPVRPPRGLRIRLGPWDCPLASRDPAECYGIPETLRRAMIVDAKGENKGGISFWHLERHNRASDERLAVVSYVGVAPELRGTGAARWLQVEVHRVLRSEGALTVGLGTGGANLRAVAFYAKLGYRPLKSAHSFHLDWNHYKDYGK